MSEDLFIPSSQPEDAIVQPLHTITYITGDKEGLERTLREGLDLESTPWMAPTGKELELQNEYFGMPPACSWEVCSFYRTGDAANVQIRVFAMHEEMPVVRPTIDGRYLGGLSIGFPMADMAGRETRMSKLGIDASVGVKEMEFTSPGGDVYVSGEIHFMAAENIFLLGVRRPEVFVPVGPIDAATGIGAPAYSARCVDNPEEVMDFLTGVLGFEIRRDATFEVAEPSGLRLSNGMPERFIQAFAPGSSSGYLVLLDHEAETIQSPAPSFGPPNRGMGMWSFPSNNLELVEKRAQQEGIRILQPCAERSSPYLPQSRTLLLQDPGGFPIEIFATDS